ncbi:hypothetical protein ANN_15247 [Periplaneta americana]|uniref:Uncharacterized protein n=1 Tax=Periplaneta americana TaxID=6978 RepID=A0ABQ8SHQ1_PERAM|nr:hypothetical protein ANN_15247 [Periplaneta americana]
MTALSIPNDWLASNYTRTHRHTASQSVIPMDRSEERGCWLFNDAVSTTRLFSVDEIGYSEMVFGEISRGFAIDYLAFKLRLGKTSEKPNQVISPSEDRTAPERNFRPAGKRLNRLIHAGGFMYVLQKNTRTRIYKTLARPILCFGSEAWTIRNIDSQRLTAAEMRFVRRTAGYTRLDHIRNFDIMKELQIEPITEYLKKYRQSWRSHIIRMPRSRIPRQILNYHPVGKRSLGTPFKRWQETVKGH